MTSASKTRVNQSITVAYFSMEIGLDSAMPTYSGGLGGLAGDTLRAAADLGISMVGVTLLHRKGYFRQHLDTSGNQSESPFNWTPEEFLEPLPLRVNVTIEGRQVWIRAWRYFVRGLSGHTVPVYFLDTFLKENNPWDQTLTDHLYGGDERYRLCQEIVLGLGGVAMLCALGYEKVRVYHKNEGHSALLALALLEEQTKGRGLQSATKEDREAVRRQCVFTTHTPVAAGHDQFPLDLVRRVLGEERTAALEAGQCCPKGVLNMTYLSLFFSYYINGVSLRHEEISQTMFSSYPINSITNGVHAFTWTAPSFCALYDHCIPEWRRDNLYLRYAIKIPLLEIKQAHAQAKQELLAEVERRTNRRLDQTAMTLGFARRATTYKRSDLLFSDSDRLRRIAHRVGPLQIIYAGKAHPRDEGGKALIRRIFEAAATLRDTVHVVYLEEYDMALAKYLCAGVDLWLNTPQKPREASGTSGMKAALNGVPSLSVLDGWWIEGHVEGVTGWSIGDSWEPESNPFEEVSSLYNKLEYVIVPMFYGRPKAFAEVMRSTIALNASFFNSQRMMSQYLKNAYQK
ncbi:MAG: alpha-glucan family phosphorylase [Deltaproteobacteria bacterium]|nr:alpha-glucan family phosphorylase [Deltaproteobacteria bacterium]